MSSHQLGLFSHASDADVRVTEIRGSPPPPREGTSGTGTVRVLFVADSHLGLDLPVRPKVERRRRGHDFLANYHRALAPALDGEADLVIHGGDVFHRPSVPATVAHQAFEPLAQVVREGTPVVVVPGNHERGRIPHARLALAAGVHLFDSPRTFRLDVRGTRVAVGGFPYERRDVRGKLTELVRQTGLLGAEADIRLLCIHHCVEGATVGPSDYVFRNNRDVIRGQDLPADVAAVLSGHIHRHQVLSRDLAGREMPAPVLYPGSIERTSFAEKDEQKGYMALELAPSETGGRLDTWRFHGLPARPMVERHIEAGGLGHDELAAAVARALVDLPSDAVVKLRVSGAVASDAFPALAAPRLRAMAPETMNVDAVVNGRRWRGSRETPAAVGA